MKAPIASVLLVFGLVQSAQAQDQRTTMYGYINGYFEMGEDHAVLDGTGAPATRATDTAPLEYDVPDIHFVVQSTMADRYKGFLNLKAPGAEGVEVSNAWVESQICEDKLAFRLGKFYRPFELYNEILDAVPTYIGIEPPELFDKDHLLVTRTTNLMFHGTAPVGGWTVRYSATTGNDERKTDQVPLGLDVRFMRDITWTIGTSYYTTGGDAAPINGYQAGGGSGSPVGGVMPWMVSDQFQVYGAYLQYQNDRIQAQASYFVADHKGVRDTAAVADMCTNTSLNDRQFTRFDCANGGVGASNADYSITAWYARFGYSLNTGLGEFTPYAQYDSYVNKETVADKDFGGDNEAGQDDDGEIAKWTAGVVYRPQPAVAIKTDFSIHEQDVVGKDGAYGEMRFSFSYYWRL